ncbi:MAG: hemerythrin domain-containing protein [Steroidobacteraceae bacterium]
MSVVDKVLAAVTPVEGVRERAIARERARASASPGDWLSLALEHHVQIDSAFSAIHYTTDAGSRQAALRDLSALLTAHAIAEENVLYPALARANARGHAELAYEEQAEVKLELALLDLLAPMGQEFLDRLEQIRESVSHHMFEEESKWFLEIKERLTLPDQDMLGARYLDEFERYRNDTDWMPGAQRIPFARVLNDGASH